jgi:uncharacterized protein YqjF (DUF2071 family)
VEKAVNAVAKHDAPVQQPRGRAFMRMRWLDLLFIHWRVDARQLRSLVPPSLEIDTFDGSAWVGLIPFTMRDVSPVFVPRIPWRGVTDFHECNVRTYVAPRDGRGELGVWFFSLDAASRLGVWGARRFWNLNYQRARIKHERTADRVTSHVHRVGHAAASMRCEWKVGDALSRSQPGELAHFLTERYCLYSAHRRGEVFRGRIWHKPWSLRNADLLVLDDGLVQAAGIDIDRSQTPVLYHSDVIDTRAWRIERM